MTRIIQLTAIAALALAGCQTTVNQGGGSAAQLPGTPSAAEQACLAGVTRAANNRDVVLLGSQPASAGTAVRVGVGAQQAPWACTAYRDGTVGEIYFMGGENDGGTAAQMPVAPGSPPFITSMAPDVSQAAIDSCRSALASQTDGGVTVVGGETSQAATAIYMRVGANGAPWRCLVSADGRNPSTMYMGN